MRSRLIYGLGLFLCLVGVCLITLGPWWVTLIGVVVGNIGFFIALSARYTA